MQPASPQSLDEQKKRIEQLRTQHQAALFKNNRPTKLQVPAPVLLLPSMLKLMI